MLPAQEPIYREGAFAGSVSLVVEAHEEGWLAKRLVEASSRDIQVIHTVGGGGAPQIARGRRGRPGGTGWLRLGAWGSETPTPGDPSLPRPESGTGVPRSISHSSLLTQWLASPTAQVGTPVGLLVEEQLDAAPLAHYVCPTTDVYDEKQPQVSLLPWQSYLSASADGKEGGDGDQGG